MRWTILLVVGLACLLSSCRKDTDDNNDDGIINIKVQIALTIGGYSYDSIPGEIKIRFADSNGITSENNFNLHAGENEIELESRYKTYTFSFHKWGIADSISFQRKDLKENMKIVLSGAKSAKKLKSETEYIIEGGSTQNYKKTDYYYNEAGLLNVVDSYSYDNITSSFEKIAVHKYQYANNLLVTLIKEDGKGMQIGNLQFDYDNLGRIVKMTETMPSGTSTASVKYIQSAGIAVRQLQYAYKQGISMQYEVSSIRGFRIFDTSATSLGSSTASNFKSDFSINPRLHTGVQDFFLSQSYLYNISEANNRYYGNQPLRNPFQYDYVINADGYPTEVLMKWKHMLSPIIGMSKIIFTYQ